MESGDLGTVRTARKDGMKLREDRFNGKGLEAMCFQYS